MLVIARYKEDLFWLNNISIPKTIYNKGPDDIPNSIKIENQGRESETYLRYIIENYNDLPNRIFFSQGNPFDHVPNFLNRLSDAYNSPDTWNAICLNNNYINESSTNNENHPGLESVLEITFKGIFNIPPPEVVLFSQGAIFGVTKRAILSRPIEFWENLHSKVIDSWRIYLTFTGPPNHNRTLIPYSPWVMERVWLYLFEMKTE